MQPAESRLARVRTPPWSAVERATDAEIVPNALGQVPQLPTQCLSCRRWVSRDRLAVSPIGWEQQCAICLALQQVSGAVGGAQLSREKEDEALEMLYDLFELLRGRG